MANLAPSAPTSAGGRCIGGRCVGMARPAAAAAVVWVGAGLSGGVAPDVLCCNPDGSDGDGLGELCRGSCGGVKAIDGALADAGAATGIKTFGTISDNGGARESADSQLSSEPTWVNVDSTCAGAISASNVAPVDCDVDVGGGIERAGASPAVAPCNAPFSAMSRVSTSIIRWGRSWTDRGKRNVPRRTRLRRTASRIQPKQRCSSSTLMGSTRPHRWH